MSTQDQDTAENGCILNVVALIAGIWGFGMTTGLVTCETSEEQVAAEHAEGDSNAPGAEASLDPSKAALTGEGEIQAKPSVFQPCPETPSEAFKPIAGWEGMCLRASRGEVIRELFYRLHEDQGDLASLVPNPGILTAAQLQAREQKALQARMESYWASTQDCTLTPGEKGRFNASCVFDHLFVGTPPTFKRSQRCEQVAVAACEQTCLSHLDCERENCGCSSSRCESGVCTPCESKQDCEPSRVSVTYAPYVAQGHLAQGDVAALKGAELVIQAKVKGPALRHLEAREPSSAELSAGRTYPGERVYDYDSGPYFSAEVEWAGFVGKDGVVLATLTSTPWEGWVELDDKHLSLRCETRLCSACLGKGCTPPSL